MARLDPHSVADSQQPQTRHLVWTAQVDFASTTLSATAELHFTAPAAAGPLDLDARGLALQQVQTLDGAPVTWAPLPGDAILGSPFRLNVPAGAKGVRLTYRTAADASALQWLAPSMTHGQRHPFLFSQCQAIHARSVVPCQDTPAVRITYEASLTVPKTLVAVMAAAPKGDTWAGDARTFHFAMPQAIPPYLLAFAVGDLASKDLSARSRVWAEPGVLSSAAWEFEAVEHHLAAAESLFGAYDWDRFDLLVMPPSFPYGGMENPRLTFLTPTLLAGDRSQVNVVAHELAHSWTGNLVTNTNAEHFWLNEGFTVYAERRILEALEGREVAELHAALGRVDLDAAIERFVNDGHADLTRLRTSLTGVDPDEAFSVVPYEKGYLFLRAMEEKLGRPAFDALLQSWLRAHRFGAADTDAFIAHWEQHAPGLLASLGASRWLDQPGVPDDAPRARSEKLERLAAVQGRLPDQRETNGWSATEWQLFLDRAPRTWTSTELAALDARFGLSQVRNSEVLVAWLTLAVQCGHDAVLPQVDRFLSTFGRMKYLKPLYGALLARAETKGRARQLFDATKERLHPIARQVISGMVARAG